MKLAELDPQLLVVKEPGLYHHVQELRFAQGVRFECPVCRNHQVLVWFVDRGVPLAEEPLPRWAVCGTGLEDLTLSPSINVAGCWHGFVKAGEVA